MNYYDVLEIKKTASQDEIKTAYKKLARVYHPDKWSEDKNIGTKDECENKFKQISEAYSILSDEEKRKSFDTYGDPNVESNGNPFEGFQQSGSNGRGMSFRFSHGGNNARQVFSQVFQGSDPFAEMGGNPFGFSSRVTPRPPQQKQIIVKDIPFTLEELYVGTTKQITVSLKGNVISENITVHPGFKEGASTTHNISHIIPNCDIKFVVKQTPHKNYTRLENGDLEYTMTLTYLEALNGFTKKIKKLDDTVLNVTLNKIKSSDYVHIIKNEGMPIRSKGKHVGKGALKIIFIITF